MSVGYRQDTLTHTHSHRNEETVKFPAWYKLEVIRPLQLLALLASVKISLSHRYSICSCSVFKIIFMTPEMEILSLLKCEVKTG